MDLGLSAESVATPSNWGRYAQATALFRIQLRHSDAWYNFLMKITHTPLVIGNWKMNPQSVGAAENLFKEVQKSVSKMRNVEVAIAAPYIYLPSLVKLAKGKRLTLLAQDAFWENLGARTGEVSFPMLKSLGVTKAILGHSERRALGETDEEVNKKVLAALKGDQHVVVCVGELKRDTHGQYLSTVEAQLRSALKGVTKTKLGHVVIAYEPVWAIGTGNTATPEDALEMKLFIQKIVSDLYGRSALSKICIIYGGSVTKGNAAELLLKGAVDGFLVGGASLRASEFVEIAKIASAHASA